MGCERKLQYAAFIKDLSAVNHRLIIKFLSPDGRPKNPMNLTKSAIRKILPRRKTDSHKGDNGRVLIIGGSIDFYGAPILSGLGALYSGCDLVYLLVPECNFEVSRSFYPDFIVRKYGGNYLNVRALDAAAPLLEKSDTVLIGPGLTNNEDILTNVIKLLKKIEVPVVLDADALPAVLEVEPKQNRPIILTPHHGEFKNLISEMLDDETPEEETMKLLKKYAEQWQAVILLKGYNDFIASADGNLFISTTGNPGMTVGGTGDVLSGLIASLLSQKLTPVEAASAGAFINGWAGDNLLEQKGFAFSATDLALELPYAIREVY